MTQRRLHFLYHELRPDGSTYSYVTSSEEFRSHCALFARLRQQEAAEQFYPEITFDDGHVSDATLAQGILDQYALTATFFITAGWTGIRPGFMSGAQLRALRAAGHRIGAHGTTHKLLTNCSPSELEEELSGSRKRLEDDLGEAVRIMSLPGGRSNARVLRACEDAGYEQIFTSEPRAVMSGGERTIGRVNLLGGTSTGWLERVLDPGSGALVKLQRATRVKALAKQILGDRLYQRLWAIGNGHKETVGASAGTAGH